MAREFTRATVLFLVLILLQVLIFNHILLFGVAAPIVFIYFLIHLKLSVGFNWLITLGFLLGLIVDICSDTLGMNALACTLLAALKKPVLMAYVQRDEAVIEISPSTSTLGIWNYSKYLITMVLIYCLLYFSIEYFSVVNIGEILLMAASSTLLSFLLMLGMDSIMIRTREQRL